MCINMSACIVYVCEITVATRALSPIRQDNVEYCCVFSSFIFHNCNIIFFLVFVNNFFMNILKFYILNDKSNR